MRCLYVSDTWARTQDMIHCEAFLPLDTTHCKKIKSKNIALCFYKARNRILIRHVLHWNRKGMKHEIPKKICGKCSDLYEVYLKILKCAQKNENYEISKFTVFSIFSPQKHKIYQKLSKLYSMYCTSLIIYKTEVTSILIWTCSWTKILCVISFWTVRS